MAQSGATIGSGIRGFVWKCVGEHLIDESQPTLHSELPANQRVSVGTQSMKPTWGCAERPVLTMPASGESPSGHDMLVSEQVEPPTNAPDLSALLLKSFRKAIGSLIKPQHDLENYGIWTRQLDV